MFDDDIDQLDRTPRSALVSDATYPKREARSAWQADQTTPSRFMPNTRIGIPNKSLPTSSKGDF